MSFPFKMPWKLDNTVEGVMGREGAPEMAAPRQDTLDAQSEAGHTLLEQAHGDIRALRGAMTTLAAALMQINQRYKPVYRVKTINTNPGSLEDFDRAHVAIWLSAATSLSFQVPGMGAATFALNPGWTPLDMPEGTMISAAAPTQVLFCWSNERLGNVL